MALECVTFLDHDFLKHLSIFQVLFTYEKPFDFLEEVFFSVSQTSFQASIHVHWCSWNYGSHRNMVPSDLLVIERPLYINCRALVLHFHVTLNNDTVPVKINFTQFITASQFHGATVTV